MLKVDILKSPHPYGANTFVLHSLDECAVVDPSVPYRDGLVRGTVRYILLTHGRFDHIMEIDSWVRASGAEVIVSKADSKMLSDPNLNCFKQFFGLDEGYFGDKRAVSEGDKLLLGDIELSVLECPGHTLGSLTYLADGTAFVGDTVFAGGGFGRWDLPTGDRIALCSSISRICSLPPETVLYCGHGETTTVRKYKEETKLQRII